MKKGHFDSKTGGNGFFFSKNEISLLRPAINEWRPNYIKHRHASTQMSTFNFQHFFNEFPAFFEKCWNLSSSISQCYGMM